MDTNNNSNTLTREQLEALLPDYAFGNLNAEEAHQFRSALSAYPELEAELKEVQDLFSKIQTMNFHEDIDRRTRNLSVKVNERMRNPARPTAMSWIRRLAPVMALCSLLMFFYYRSVHKGAEFASFDDELAGLLAKDSGALASVQNSADQGMLPLSMIPHDFISDTVMVAQDTDQLDGLMAESIIRASNPDSDQITQDEQSNEALDLINSVDIQDVEQQIWEVENGEG